MAHHLIPIATSTTQERPKLQKVFEAPTSTQGAPAEARKKAIITVHSLAGESNAENFPVINNAWLQDVDPPCKAVYAFTYQADIITTELLSPKGIRRLALLLLESINTHEDISDEALVFISHGFGGILIKEALWLASYQHHYMSIAAAVVGAVFYETPEYAAPKEWKKIFLDTILEALGRTSTDTCFGQILALSESRNDINRVYLSDVCERMSTFRKVHPLVVHYIPKKKPVGSEPTTLAEERRRHRRIRLLYHLGSPEVGDNRWLVHKVRALPSHLHGSPSLECLSFRQLVASSCSSITAAGETVTHLPQPGTCTWILDTSEYIEWERSQERPILQLRGGFGTGKSTLCYFLTRALENAGFMVLSVFCARSDEHSGSEYTRNILMSLVSQLLLGEPQLHHYIQGLKIVEAPPTSWTKEDIWGLLRIMLSRTRRRKLVCLFDDLDKCRGDRWLMEQFIGLQKETDFPYKLLVSGDRFFSNSALKEAADHHRLITIDLVNDLGQCRREVSADAERLLEIWTPSQILRRFPSYAKTNLQEQVIAMFLADIFRKNRNITPLSLNLSLGLFTTPTITRISEAISVLKAAPCSRAHMAVLYSKLLNTIAKEDHELAAEVLRWLCYAFRPLTLEELSVALSLSLDEDPILPTRLATDIARVFGSLISIDGPRIYLVHSSLKDFLIKQETHDHGVSSDKKADSCPWYSFGRPGLLPSRILEISLSHIRSHAIASKSRSSAEEEEAVDRDVAADTAKSMGGQPEDSARDTASWWQSAAQVSESPSLSFLAYAAEYWAKHYQQGRDSDTQKNAQLTSLVRSFLDDPQTCMPWYRFYSQSHQAADTAFEPCSDEDDHPKWVLRIATTLGLTDIVETLLASGDSITQTQRQMVFDTAALLGHESIIRTLLACSPGPAIPKALQNACHMGHVPLVETLLDEAEQRGVLKNIELGPALCAAATSGHQGTVAVLLDRKAPIDHRSAETGMTPMQLAAKNGWKEVVEALLLEKEARGKERARSPKDTDMIRSTVEEAEEGGGGNGEEDNGGGDGGEDGGKLSLPHPPRSSSSSSSSSGGDDGDDGERLGDVYGHEEHLSLLHLAAGGGHLAIIEMLLTQWPAELERFNDRAKTSPIHLAARGGYCKAVQRLAAKYPEMVRSRDLLGYSPLHLACQEGHLEVIHYLLQQAPELAAVSSTRDGLGRRPLHMAAMSGHAEVIDALLKKKEELKLDSNARDKTGAAPLHLACIAGHYKAVERLTEEAEVGVELYDGDFTFGQTPLHHAVDQGHVDIIDRLLDKNASIEKPTRGLTKWTPLHTAYRQPKSIKRLLERGANTESRNTNGSTPLILAAQEGNTDGVRYLLEAGANVHAINRRNKTSALHRAMASNEWDTIALLLKAGIEPFLLDDDDCTAIEQVNDDNAKKTIAWLLEEDLWPDPFLRAMKSGSMKLVQLWLKHRPEDAIRTDLLDYKSEKGTPFLFKILLWIPKEEIEIIPKVLEKNARYRGATDAKGRGLLDVVGREELRKFLKTTTDMDVDKPTEGTSIEKLPTETDPSETTVAKQPVDGPRTEDATNFSTESDPEQSKRCKYLDRGVGKADNCDRCDDKIADTFFYHCCHCYTDRFFLCLKCRNDGKHCFYESHTMRARFIYDDFWSFEELSSWVAELKLPGASGDDVAGRVSEEKKPDGE